MGTWTRREALVGALSTTALACAGGGTARVPRGIDIRPPSGGGAMVGQCSVFGPGPREMPPRQTYADQPAWLRSAPALWVPTAESAGAGVIMMSDDDRLTLSRRMDSFRRLPELLDTAQSLGTSVVYLVDWYEGAAGAGPEGAWRNKGDWQPRSDLGGADALKRGISAIADRGGRVVLYTEPFLFAETSEMGRSKGEAWSLRDENGRPPDDPYPGNWKICPSVEAYQEYMGGVARRMGGYGADGIFLDSYGFQRGWACTAKNHGHAPGDPDAFAKGCVEVARRMGEGLRSQKPQGALICEGPVVLGMFTQVSATLDWGIHRLTERGLWAVQGRTDTITTGYSIDDLHQIVAVGGKLALSQQYTEAPRGSSAVARLRERRQRKMPGNTAARHYWAAKFFYETHMWRNSAILAGIRVPGLDDVAPRRGEHEEDIADAGRCAALLDRLEARAGLLDEAIGGRKLGAPTAHVRQLCEARAALSPYVDQGCSTESVPSGSDDAVAWSHSSDRGVATTVVNVSDDPVSVDLPRTGRGKDLFSGESVGGGRVEVPAHGVRLIVPA